MQQDRKIEHRQQPLVEIAHLAVAGKQAKGAPAAEVEHAPNAAAPRPQEIRRRAGRACPAADKAAPARRSGSATAPQLARFRQSPSRLRMCSNPPCTVSVADVSTTVGICSKTISCSSSETSMGVACKNVVLDSSSSRCADRILCRLAAACRAAPANRPCCWHSIRARIPTRSAAAPRASSARRLVHAASSRSISASIWLQRGAHAACINRPRTPETPRAAEGLPAVAGQSAARQKTCARARAVAAWLPAISRASLPRSSTSVSRASSSKRILLPKARSSWRPLLQARAPRQTPPPPPRAELPRPARPMPSASRQVGKEQVVVDDNDVRLKRLAPHLGNEAAPVVGAG